MEAVSKKYKDKLAEIKMAVSGSELLNVYLDTEEETDYKALLEAFEPAIADLHKEVINKDPMQILDFEKHLLNDEFEGLFLPRILGYSVLRGEIDNAFKFRFSQDHFRDIFY